MWWATWEFYLVLNLLSFPYLNVGSHFSCRLSVRSLICFSVTLGCRLCCLELTRLPYYDFWTCGLWITRGDHHGDSHSCSQLTANPLRRLEANLQMTFAVMRDGWLESAGQAADLFALLINLLPLTSFQTQSLKYPLAFKSKSESCDF